ADWEAALADLTRAIEINPNDPEVYFERAGVYRQLKDDAAYEADMAKASELDPNIGKIAE
ncbi:MAG: tetratricopeptide repeat protein, partial [Thermoguttaceae bacterium]|nr:tetratricopeptide repeat protein [Thermoguttaceae bacterium]